MAIFSGRDRFGRGHDMVSKPRDRRRRDCYRVAPPSFCERRNGDLVVRRASLRPYSIDGDLPQLAI